jgi:DNA-binding CsgD family transcriptional regulator
MGESVGLRDLRAAIDIVQAGRLDEPTAGLPWAVLDGLAALVRCDSVSFYEADVTRRETLLLQWNSGGERGMGDDCDRPPDDCFWVSAGRFAPCTYPHRTGDLSRAITWSDCYSAAELRNEPMFADYYGPVGLRHGMHVAFPALPGRMRKVSFWRCAGRDFTQRDRLIMQLLRPHLWESYAEMQRRRANSPRLTRRECEVLTLVRQGYSNVEIARRLVVSPATVRKHLENVFSRTGVRSRTAAALMLPGGESWPTARS